MVTARSSKRHQKAAAIGQKRVAKVKEEEPTSEYEWFDEPSKDEEDEEYQDEDEKEGDEDEDEDEDSDDDETEDLGEVKERPPKPKVMKKKIKVLYQEMQDGTIRLNPPYQRDEVWSTSKSKLFVDTALGGWATHGLLLSSQEIDGATVKVCMDGKQRLTAIKDFMDGNLSIKYMGHQTFYPSQDRQSAQKKNRRVLSSNDKILFDNRTLIVQEFSGMTDSMERETFNRLQLGASLTSAERLQAIGTNGSRLVRRLADTYLAGEESIAEKLMVKTHRGLGFMLVAQVIYMVKSSPYYQQATTKKVEAFLRSVKVSKAEREKVELGFQRLSKLLVSSTYTARIAKTPKSPVAPVEFVHICLVCVLQPGWKNKQMCDTLVAMRTFVRKAHQDIRSNSKVASSFQEFLEYTELLKKNTPKPKVPLGRKRAGKKSPEIKVELLEDPAERDSCGENVDDRRMEDVADAGDAMVVETSVLGESVPEYPEKEYTEMEWNADKSDVGTVIEGSVSEWNVA